MKSISHTHTHTHTQSYGTLSQSTLNMSRQWLLLQDLQGVGEKYYYFLYSKKLNRVLMFIAWRQNHTLFKSLLFPGCLPLWTCNFGVGTKSPCRQSIPTCFNTVRKWPCNTERNTKDSAQVNRVFVVVQSLSCVLTLCDSMDCSMPGFPLLHHLPELVQTHTHWVGDAIQSSPLSSPSPPAFYLSPASGSFPISWLFVSDGQVLELLLQHQSFQ